MFCVDYSFKITRRLAIELLIQRSTTFHRIDAAPRLVATLEQVPHNPRAERNGGRPRIDAATKCIHDHMVCYCLLRSLVILYSLVLGVWNFCLRQWHSIHCLNSGGVASEALPTITENTATLLSEAQRQDDDRNPFADLDNDKEELETKNY